MHEEHDNSETPPFLAETAPFVPTQGPYSVEHLNAKIAGLEVLEFLGRGGMGAVYKARQPRLDREVALKILLPATGDASLFHRQFQVEAKAMARLSHPNVVVVHDFGSAEELDYLVMEFVRGGTLKVQIAAGPVPLNTAYSILSQICQALDYAHEEGVIHRDVKPENVLIEPRGRVRLADFGLAKLLSTGATDGLSERAAGTPVYMAPEQFANAADVDHRADIYSAGVMLYEMLTGKLPQPEAAPPSQQGTGDSRLDCIVMRALAKEREKRHQSAAELAEELAALCRTEDSTVIVRSTLPAAIDDVFRAWTDPASAEHWLAPSDEMTTEVHEMTAAVGGRFALAMSKGENRSVARGAYCEIRRPEKIVFTWAWDTEKVEPNETQVTIRLHKSGGQTELVLIHERLSSQKSCDSHRQGWTGVLERLARYLKK